MILPDEYKDAFPIEKRYVELDNKVFNQIGYIAQEYFKIYGWQEVKENYYVLEDDSLLNVVEIADTTHYIVIPRKSWRMIGKTQ